MSACFRPRWNWRTRARKSSWSPRPSARVGRPTANWPSSACARRVAAAGRAGGSPSNGWHRRALKASARSAEGSRDKRAGVMNIVRAIARVLAWIPFLLLARALPAADAVDLHRLWDGRCAECHGHSAEFARSLLTVNEGRLAGRHHRDDLATFLHNHYLAGSHVDEVYAMLLAQVVTPPRFAE